MASDAQITANRANAARSTGPRTPEGKARSSRNSLRHGAFSDALLNDECRGEFKALRAEYLAQYQPVNPTERFLVARLAVAAWKLNRLGAMEARVVSDHQEGAVVNREWAHALSDILRVKLLAHALDENELYTEPEREAPTRDPVARAYISDCEGGNTIGKLARYQTAVERSYYRALQALEHVRGQR